MNNRNPVVRSSRRLPSGRAVVGGLLITLAVLATLAAARIGSDSTFQEIVVARRDLAPGVILGPDDLTVARVRLDQSVDFVVADPEQVYGSVLLGPLGRLEFLQSSNVASSSPGETPSGLAEVSVAIEPDRAPAELSPGELVSVLATFRDEDPTTTRLIADRVVVLSYRREDGDFGNDAVLRLGLDDGTIAMALVNAAQTADLSIVGIMAAPNVVLPAESVRLAAGESS